MADSLRLAIIGPTKWEHRLYGLPIFRVFDGSNQA